MTTKTLSRWEQDGAGGDHGTLTLCLSVGDVTVHLPSFAEAHALQQAIQAEMREVRHDARQDLINQIARIQP